MIQYLITNKLLSKYDFTYLPAHEPHTTFTNCTMLTSKLMHDLREGLIEPGTSFIYIVIWGSFANNVLVC